MVEEVAETAAGGACGVLYDCGDVSVFGDRGVLGAFISGTLVFG